MRSSSCSRGSSSSRRDSGRIILSEFSKEQLLADNLIITKAMLIEKSKNKEELYKNIEEVINIQKEKKAFDNLQLEKLITYELSETEDKNIMHEFIEKIREYRRE